MIFSLSQLLCLLLISLHYSPTIRQPRVDSKPMSFMNTLHCVFRGCLGVAELPRACRNTFMHVREGAASLSDTCQSHSTNMGTSLSSIPALHTPDQNYFSHFRGSSCVLRPGGLCAPVMLGSAGCPCPHTAASALISQQSDRKRARRSCKFSPSQLSRTLT